MDWEKQLSKYEGSPIRIWIEDRSGEEQTQPKPFTLYKVQQSVSQDYIQFFLNPTQFLSVPIFEGEQTIIDYSDSERWFVSHDIEAKLLYWVYLDKQI
ncbi:MAG: hypothetical protein WDZ91_05580 [Paenibacillaceae bacterium]